MIPSRYVRVGKGAFVCQRRDLMGVVGQLQMLARHLEQLMPDEDAFAKLLKSRDFTGGFQQRKQYEDELARIVLEALAERPSETCEYTPLEIEGYSGHEIESCVFRLWKAGLVDAEVREGAIDSPLSTTTPKTVTPWTLTTKGFQALEKLSVPVSGGLKSNPPERSGKALATKGKA